MGYTHYFENIKAPASLEQAEQVQQAIGLVLEYHNGLLQYEYDNELPPVNTIEEEDGTYHNIIRFNGIDEDGHETFYVDTRDSGFNFCKTNRKPYDQAVCECLLVLKHFLGADVSSNGFSNPQPSVDFYNPGDTVIDTDLDGTWGGAVNLINQQLGTNYNFVVDKVYGDGKYFSYELS
jgi:hypothetical protein